MRLKRTVIDNDCVPSISLVTLHHIFCERKTRVSYLMSMYRSIITTIDSNVVIIVEDDEFVEL